MLDRRRLEAAHLKYAALQTAAHYSDYFATSDMVFYTDVQETLEKITPTFYSAFQAHYSGNILQNRYLVPLIKFVHSL